MSSPTEWYKDNFLISTKPSLVQPDAINEAFAMESMYWISPMETTLLKKMLDNSLCFGVYELPNSSSELAGKTNPKQIGLARIVTDYVSFAYLTDVYILEGYQRKGLGRWLIECVDKEVSTWPLLRWVQLFTSDAGKFYEEKLGVRNYEQGKNGLFMMSRRGPGAFNKD